MSETFEVVLDPAAPLCVECGLPFVPLKRAQGGGTVRKYCSPKCRSNSWARGNTGKRKVSVIKYDAKPESKEQKRERTLRGRFKKYGLTEERFNEMLSEQAHKCLGCALPLTRHTARIDHDHATGRVRGLLCNPCNWALGHAKDNPTVLRALAAYLEEA